MNRQTAIIIGFAAILGILAGGPASAANDTSPDGRYSFALESGGTALPTYYFNDYTWVEGYRGSTYAIRVYNHTGNRVEAVVTVDGRDVVSGREGDWRNNRGYVIEPWGSVLIDGFRNSFSRVAEFYFTDVADSYAARMGSDADVGVIGVAIFEEERPVPRPQPKPIITRRNGRTGTGYGAGPAKSAPESPAPAARGQAECCDDLSIDADAAKRERQGIGTGYGDYRYSPASKTEFERRSRRPDARLAIYYDDRSGLISRGIIREPRPYPRPLPHPRPFPCNDDPAFAPPPPPSPVYREYR